MQAVLVLRLMCTQQSAAAWPPPLLLLLLCVGVWVCAAANKDRLPAIPDLSDNSGGLSNPAYFNFVRCEPLPSPAAPVHSHPTRGFAVGIGSSVALGPNVLLVFFLSNMQPRSVYVLVCIVAVQGLCKRHIDLVVF